MGHLRSMKGQEVRRYEVRKSQRSRRREDVAVARTLAKRRQPADTGTGRATARPRGGPRRAQRAAFLAPVVSRAPRRTDGTERKAAGVDAPSPHPADR